MLIYAKIKRLYIYMNLDIKTTVESVEPWEQMHLTISQY